MSADDILCGRPVTFDLLSWNWHTGYSCLVEHSHRFRFLDAFLFSC